MGETTIDVGATVLVEADAETRLRAAEFSGKPPEPESAGECPYCHGMLERKQVTQATGAREMLFGAPTPKVILQTYWACTNEGCSLMFWRRPRKPEIRVRPYTGGDVEH